MLIGSIGRFVDHPRGGSKRKGAATTGMLGAPVGHRGIVDAAKATHTDHVLVEPGRSDGEDGFMYGLWV